MNGLPTAITVALMVSNHYSVEQMEELYTGVREACRVHRVQLAGGDVSSSASGLGINVTVLGKVRQDRVTYRSGAKANDLICVSGDLGAAFAGLNLLKREQAVFRANPGVQPDLSGFEYVLERQLRPEARRSVVEALAEIDLRPTSMIDISDGLASELHHLATASGLGAMIYQNRLPLDHQTQQVAEDFEMAATEYALYGGEDYELLFTVPATLADQVRQLAGISIIGYMTDDHPGVRMIDNESTLTEIQPLGWTHFGQATQGSESTGSANHS
jgi:thiamine-monophosphate kinase